MKPTTPQYDFNDPVFRTNLQYKCWAREHQELASMHSSVIRWEAVETVSPLKIPVVYHIHYQFKTIVGIDKALNPIFGDNHVLELSIPPLYPLEGCKITMLTDVWHPNVKSEGRFKGRVCGNVDSFGITYDLYQLVLRVGEILQYKNYHAEDIPPFPEDKNVAEWVREFAEPQGILDKENGVAVDYTPLLSNAIGDNSSAKPTAVNAEPEPIPEPDPEPVTTDTAPPPAEEELPRIKISALRHNVEPPKKITIRPKD